MMEPFSSFMRRALFDPERGYYSRQIRTVGQRGDFSTAATLSPLLAAGVGGWVRQSLSVMKGVRAVIEVGGGDGSLMQGVRRELGWWQRRRVDWHMVETSPVLREQQRTRLGAGAISWHEDLRDALGAAGGAALIYHNELLDAFPCERIEWDAEAAAWKEIWVDSDGGQAMREERRAKTWTPAETAAFQVLRDWAAPVGPPVPRQRVELHSTVREWLAGWAPHWCSGAMLTIDYGDEFPAVYHRRPGGTVRGYWYQQRTEGAEIYLHPGRQDLTADVNFSDYRRWAADLGWREKRFDPLRTFLRYHASGRVAAAVGTDALLLEEGSAADAFRVVEHHRA